MSGIDPRWLDQARAEWIGAAKRGDFEEAGRLRLQWALALEMRDSETRKDPKTDMHRPRYETAILVIRRKGSANAKTRVFGPGMSFGEMLAKAGFGSGCSAMGILEKGLNGELWSRGPAQPDDYGKPHWEYWGRTKRRRWTKANTSSY